MPEKEQIQVDLYKAREIAVKYFNTELKESNKIWYSILRLIITLSSSFLVLTIALVEKMFPPAQGAIDLPKLLFLSWIFLFCALIFGIIAELNEIIFRGNQASKWSKSINDYTTKIVQGKQTEIIESPKYVELIHYNSIIWGAICINCFILALISMCASLLTKIFPDTILIGSYTIAVFFIVWVNFYLLGKRKK
jgi:hypothetical protein